MKSTDFQLSEAQSKRFKAYRNPWIFKWVMWRKLPSVSFWGVKIGEVDESHCSVAVSYRWKTQNPFGSIYFAALAGAAELSTGIMMDCLLAGKGKTSMLVTNFNMDFVRKAKGNIVFTCQQGNQILDAIAEANENPEGCKIQLLSEGKNDEGEIVAKASITWSIKIRR